MTPVCSQNDIRQHYGGRLRVLLADRSDGPWARQLPRLLQPQGVTTIRVTTVGDAVAQIEAHPIHAAVIDLATPIETDRNDPTVRSGHVVAGGLKLLRVIHRLDPTPPAVVVRGRYFDRKTDDRLLRDALKLDAFSVLDEPVELEQVLETLRRLLQRHYGGAWPTEKN